MIPYFQMSPEPCPRCGSYEMHANPNNNAVSRHDNKTFVCNSCGQDEAMIDFANRGQADVWPGFPGLLVDEVVRR